MSREKSKPDHSRELEAPILPWYSQPIGSKPWVAGWILDDCAVTICEAGMIHYQNHNCLTVARCPRCDRARAELPTLPVYQGRVELHSPEEMTRRRNERIKIADSEDERLERAREVARGLHLMIRQDEARRIGSKPKNQVPKK